MKEHAIFFEIGIAEENDCECVVLDEILLKNEIPKLGIM